MGECAKRLRDGANIKIGTCSRMYYCRYDQRNLVDYGYSTNNLLWRIPAIEEDGIEVGEFEYGGLYRSYDLGNGVKSRYLLTSVMLHDFPKNSELAEIADNVGNVQAEIKSLGMYLNVPCHHGIKLPENTGGIKSFFNGKRNPLHLCFLKNTETELLIGIRCIACNNMWTCSFNEIEPYIFDDAMRFRLLKMCSEYWHSHNENGICPYNVTIQNGDHQLSIRQFERQWYCYYDGDIKASNSYEEAERAFKSCLKTMREEAAQ